MKDPMQLTEGIRAVLPHVSHDYTLPILTNVYVTPTSVMATDRYTLARVTVPTGVKEGEELLIPYELARLGIVSIQPTEGGHTVTTALPPKVKRFAPKVAAPTWFLPADVKAGYPALDMLIDGWKPMVTKPPVEPTSDDDIPWGKLGLTPDLLNRWASRHFSRGGGVGILVEFGTTPMKPLRITVEGVDNYVSLLVPRRTF